jgi:NADPH:quinone reductase-like Zn-dependent oxidoreductase
VRRLAVGDDVFGCLPYGPFNKRRAFAESVIVREVEVGVKPASVSHRAAAAAATTGLKGLQGVRRLPPRGVTRRQGHP